MATIFYRTYSLIDILVNVGYNVKLTLTMSVTDKCRTWATPF
jgi:hypothetical protein